MKWKEPPYILDFAQFFNILCHLPTFPMRTSLRNWALLKTSPIPCHRKKKDVDICTNSKGYNHKWLALDSHLIKKSKLHSQTKYPLSKEGFASTRGATDLFIVTVQRVQYFPVFSCWDLCCCFFFFLFVLAACGYNSVTKCQFSSLWTMFH